MCSHMYIECGLRGVLSKLVYGTEQHRLRLVYNMTQGLRCVALHHKRDAMQAKEQFTILRRYVPMTTSLLNVRRIAQSASQSTVHVQPWTISFYSSFSWWCGAVIVEGDDTVVFGYGRYFVVEPAKVTIKICCRNFACATLAPTSDTWECLLQRLTYCLERWTRYWEGVVVTPARLEQRFQQRRGWLLPFGIWLQGTHKHHCHSATEWV